MTFASVPAGFGPGSKVVVEERAAGPGTCFSAPASSDFYVFSCAAWGRARSRSWTAAATTVTLLDEVYAFHRSARWRARSRCWTAAATTLLDEVYYPTTDPTADFGPGPEAPPAANFGPGPEGAAEGRPTRRGILLFIVFPSHPLLRAWPGGNGEGAYGQRVCVPAPLATDFGPMETWLEGLLLPLAMAGPAGDCKNALLRRRLRFMLPTMPDLHREKRRKRIGKRWPDTLRFQPGQLARRERHRRSTCCC